VTLAILQDPIRHLPLQTILPQKITKDLMKVVTPSEGTSESLPSNSTDIKNGGSKSNIQEESSDESALNQSSVESPSSANQSGVTGSSTGFNGSSTGLSTGLSAAPAMINETGNVVSGSSANDIRNQPLSESSEISVASASDPNAVTQDISPGDAQHVSFGDISNQNNATKEIIVISLDKKSYNLEDSPKVQRLLYLMEKQTWVQMQSIPYRLV
jgi:hypothetical protein